MNFTKYRRTPTETPSTKYPVATPIASGMTTPMVVLKNSAHFERYVSGIFDNRWKKEE
jgi:hypothetical protein